MGWWMKYLPWLSEEDVAFDMDEVVVEEEVILYDDDDDDSDADDDEKDIGWISEGCRIIFFLVLIIHPFTIHYHLGRLFRMVPFVYLYLPFHFFHHMLVQVINVTLLLLYFSLV